MVVKLKESEKEFLELKYIALGYSREEAKEEVNNHISLIIIPKFPMETFK